MPPHPSPEFFLSRDSLSSEASSYAQNLEAQIKVIYQQFGAHTWEEFQRLAQSPKSPIPLETLDKLHNLLQQLDYIRKEGKVPETETCFIVQNARNLFRDALIAGGIPDTDPCTAEHKDIEVNLKQSLESDIASYRASGLEHWAVALEAIRGDIIITPEKQRIIEQEVKEGAIIIFMPGKQAQSDTTPEQYKHNLKPVWIKDSQPQAVADAHLWEHTEKLIKERDPSLFADIPDRPYILLIKPTQKPDPRTCSKTVPQQQAELEKINQERVAALKQPLASIKPAEYGALQQRFTQTLNNESPQPLITLNPPDIATLTRFIDLLLSSGGSVPCGDFFPGNRGVGLGAGNAASTNSLGGFRSAVRVEI